MPPPKTYNQTFPPKSYNQLPPKSYNYEPPKPFDLRSNSAFRPSDRTQIAIRTEALWGDDSGLVVARLSDTSPQIISGGGWEDVGRPLRRGIARWRGTAVPTLPLSLILCEGEIADRKSIEKVCETLGHMAGGLVGGDPEPPELLLYGGLLPRQAREASRRWVIAEPPAWDTSRSGVIRRRDGHRIWQLVDLVLMLKSNEEPLRVVKPHAAQPRYRHIKARSGDTFERIAKRELGTKRLAHRLAQLNGKGGGSVSVRLRQGTKIKVPTGALLAEWKRDLKKKGG